MPLSTWVGCLTLGALSIAGGSATLAGRESGTTLGDLQIAYNIECNAREHYLVYAEQADQQGYHKVASLMRAAARGEAVHAAVQAADILRMGGTPRAEITPVPLRSLRDHLTAAIAEESYERDHMYTLFASDAREEANDGIQATFDRTRYAESTHAELFQQALTSFDHMKRKQPFCVCSGCGAVMREVEDDQCIGCGTRGEQIVRVE